MLSNLNNGPEKPKQV